MSRSIPRPIPVLAAAFLLAPMLGAGLLAHPVAAADYAKPQPPSNVTATVVKDGIRVTWAPSPVGAPVVTNYVVHAGTDSCPVTVGASATSALMPFIKGPTSVTPEVQAVNAYGFSADAAGNTVTVPSTATPGFRNVQFLEFSDFHGALEKSSSAIGAPVLTTALAADRLTVKSTFTVSAGDNIGGAPVISSEFGELPTIEALNLMKVDVSTFGNHEHDRPLPHLRQMIDASDFAWVASNYDTLKPLQGKVNSPTPYVIEERGGVKVGFVGMNTPGVAELVKAGNLDYGRNLRNTLVVTPSVKVVQRSVAAARAAGAQLVVALVHEGWEVDLDGAPVGDVFDTARRLTGVDVVFGAHTHQKYSSVLNGIPVVEVPNSGQMYSRTVVCLDTTTGRAIGSSVDFVTKAQVANVTEDPATAALIAGYKAQLGPLLDGVVGTVSGIFPRGGTPPVERSGETPMGDFAADAVRTAYGTDFAFLGGGGIRDTMPAAGYAPRDPSLRRPGPGTTGPYHVTLGDVIAVFPFGSNAATTTMTGASLWRALENGVSNWPTDGRFPQISGFRFTFDPTRPVGSRIISVTRTDGTPIAADGTVYTVATIDYMVTGGDGYRDVFSPATAVIRGPYLDAVLAALRSDLAKGVVTQVPVPDGRITRVTG